MIKYVLAFILFSPLIGIYIMQQGVVSLTSYDIGYPNGAFEAFFAYIVIILVSLWLTYSTKFLNIPLKQVNTSSFNFHNAGKTAFYYNVLIFLIILLGFGSINTFLGLTNKGDFRITLGGLGFVAFGLSRWVSPALLTFAAVLYYKDSEKSPTKKKFLIAHFVVVMIMMASWGFKSSAVWFILPALFILNWQISRKKIVLYSIIAFASFIVFQTVFDGGTLNSNQELVLTKEIFDNNLGGKNALVSVLYRITVLQGDVSWILWERYNSHYEFPSYSKTLISGLGNNIASLLLSENELRNADFSKQLTAIASGSVLASDLTGSYNVTGTAFSEGIMLGGVIGVIVIAVLAGILLGGCYKFLYDTIVKNRFAYTSVSAVYYLNILSWLNGGGVVALFHFSNMIFLIFTYFLLKFIESNSKIGR